MAFEAPSLKGRALRALAQREHSRAELERKLARQLQQQHLRTASADGGSGLTGRAAAGGESEGESVFDADGARSQIAAALDELAAKGLQSDERTAASVLRSQGTRYGTRRLQQTLQQRQLAPELVAATLQEARGTELARAQEVWRKRFGAAPPPADAAERARQMRFLAGRGFAGEVVHQVMRGAGNVEHIDGTGDGLFD